MESECRLFPAQWSRSTGYFRFSEIGVQAISGSVESECRLSLAQWSRSEVYFQSLSRTIKTMFSRSINKCSDVYLIPIPASDSGFGLNVELGY